MLVDLQFRPAARSAVDEVDSAKSTERMIGPERLMIAAHAVGGLFGETDYVVDEQR